MIFFPFCFFLKFSLLFLYFFFSSSISVLCFWVSCLHVVWGYLIQFRVSWHSFVSWLLWREEFYGPKCFNSHFFLKSSFMWIRAFFIYFLESVFVLRVGVLRGEPSSRPAFSAVPVMAGAGFGGVYGTSYFAFVPVDPFSLTVFFPFSATSPMGATYS